MNIYENILFGEGDDSIFCQTCERYLEQARQQQCRLQIEIRSSARGTSTSQQESKFSVDPNETTAETIQHEVIARLNESPGEGFQGQIRVLFREAGSSDNKFGSFQRTINKLYMPAPRNNDDEEYEDVESYEDIEPARPMRREIDNSAVELHALQMAQAQAHRMGGIGEPLRRTPALVDADTLKEYMEIAFGFAFRSQAQNAVMFQRTTEIMEAIGLRFGVIPPDQLAASRAITAQSQQSGGGDAGAGMLMGLLKAAMTFAAAESPKDVIQTVGSLAAGQEPDDTGARKIAAKAGAKALQALDRHAESRAIQRHTPGHTPAHEYDDLDDDYEDLDDTHRDRGDDNSHQAAPSDLTNLSPEEMKDAVVKWMRASPANKGAVMGMVPDLMNELE